MALRTETVTSEELLTALRRVNRAFARMEEEPTAERLEEWGAEVERLESLVLRARRATG